VTINSYSIEQDVIEYLIDNDITEACTVLLDDGSVAFGITPSGA